MDAFINSVEHVFTIVVRLGITFLETVGVMVLVIAAFNALICYFRRDRQLLLQLAKGIALGLEFKLGGEVLRTTLVRDWHELGILGAIVLLRMAMTLLIHWEIKNEEARHNAPSID
ncbi:MAG: DUF1622 domain-containing protein [Christensenellales bacterium]